MLVFSSRSVTLLSCPTPPSAASLVPRPPQDGSAASGLGSADLVTASLAAAAASMSAPALAQMRRKLIQWELPGVPTCAEWVALGLLVLGDSMAGEEEAEVKSFSTRPCITYQF